MQPYSQYAQLQDYNYYLRGYLNSRYSGSRTTSRYYNVYSPSSSAWQGDSSYGKTAAVDRNSYKIGWVRDIPSENLNFYDKTIIYLKYLVDIDRNLTELSARNTNVIEVQNTFKSGDDVVLSITNVQSPTNQVSLDGTKSIFKGGYFYDPIVYRELNEPLSFIFNRPIDQSTQNVGVKAYCSDGYHWQAREDQYGIQTFLDRGNDCGENAGEDNGWYGNSRLDTNGYCTSDRALAFYADPNGYSYNNHPDNRINQNYPGCSMDPDGYTDSSSTVFMIDILKYRNIIYNTTDPSAYTPDNHDHIFRAPKRSTYQFKAKIPYNFWAKNTNQHQHGCDNVGARGFKIFGMLEKTSDPAAGWNFVDSTRINITGTTNQFAANAAYNWLEYNDISGASMDLLIDTTVDLNEPSVTICGWRDLVDCRLDKYWRTTPKVRKESWWIPQSDLHDMKSLRERLVLA
ncbi:hypothetical protein EBZ39_10320 [bacterium]|nr:hypothetical protein [bacterium]